MSTEKNKWLFVGLIFLAVLSRFLPHPPNFSPIIGVALFAGASFKSRSMALIVPLLAMLASDFVLGFHSTMWAVYISLIAIGLVGTFVLKGAKAQSLLRLTSVSTAAAVFFFVISNAAVWISQEIYPRTAEGLVSCFVMAVPFFPATLISAWVYSGALFGLASLVRVAQRQTQVS